MIIEPSPTTPGSPSRRRLGAVALAAPVLLLAVAVTAGLLGREPASTAVVPPATGDGRAPADDPAATRTTAPAQPSGAAATGPTAIPSGAPPPPVQFGDLRVLPVARAAEAAATVGPATAVALSGLLWVIGPFPGCETAAADPLGPWCDREAILVDWTFATGSTFATDRPPQVQVQVPVGVRVPAAVSAATAPRGGDGPQVVLVGRFCGGDTCLDPDGRMTRFVVDRFAWVDGVRVGLTPLIADRLDTGTRRANPFLVALDAADLPLLAVLVWPDRLAAIDPDAAALATALPPSQPVWYLRLLDGAREPGLERRVRWVVLDESRLQVIGSGRAGGTPAALAGSLVAPGEAAAVPGETAG